MVMHLNFNQISHFGQRQFFLLGIVFITLTGCGRAVGLLYTDVHRPVVTNMRNTPRGASLATSSAIKIKVPTTSADIGVELKSRAIGDAAQKSGMCEIYYADLHTVSILLGIWEQKTIEVYGRMNKDSCEVPTNISSEEHAIAGAAQARF